MSNVPGREGLLPTPRPSRGPLDHGLQRPLPGGLLKGLPPWPDTRPFLRYNPDTRLSRHRRPDVSSQPDPTGCPAGDIPRGRLPTTPAGDMSRVRGRPSCPQARGLHPSMSNVPGREGLLPTPRPSRGPLGRLARDGNEPIVSTSDTKARAGPTRTKENRMIPRFTWTAEERWRSFVTDLDILARDRRRRVISVRCRARRGVPRP